MDKITIFNSDLIEIHGKIVNKINNLGNNSLIITNREDP